MADLNNSGNSGGGHSTRPRGWNPTSPLPPPDPPSGPNDPSGVTGPFPVNPPTTLAGDSSSPAPVSPSFVPSYFLQTSSYQTDPDKWERHWQQAYEQSLAANDEATINRGRPR